MRLFCFAWGLLAMVSTSAAAKDGTSACIFPNDYTFYVDDIQIVSGPPYGPAIYVAMRPRDREQTLTYFKLSPDALRDRSMTDAYLALILSRIRDEKFGVEPKAKPKTGDGKLMQSAYELESISFGALPGGC